MSKDFEKALETAMAKLQQAIFERQALDKRILELRQVVASLNAVVKHDVLQHSDATSISTEEVRHIMNANRGKIMSAADVAEELKKLGYQLGEYESPLSTIGVILNRLKDKGELVPAREDSGKRGFTAPPEPIWKVIPALRLGMLAKQLDAERNPKK
jgi:hypothetical protein